MKRLEIETFESVTRSSFREIGDYEKELKKKLHGDANHSPLYAVLVAIYKGENSRDKIYSYFKYFYSTDMRYIKFFREILDGIVQTGINEGLINEKGSVLSLTDTGNDIIIKARKTILTHARGAKIFFNEKAVLLISLVILVLMSLLKISFALNTGSDALFNEGIY